MTVSGMTVSRRPLQDKSTRSTAVAQWRDV